MARYAVSMSIVEPALRTDRAWPGWNRACYLVGECPAGNGLDFLTRWCCPTWSLSSAVLGSAVLPRSAESGWSRG